MSGLACLLVIVHEGWLVNSHYLVLLSLGMDHQGILHVRLEINVVRVTSSPWSSSPRTDFHPEKVFIDENLPRRKISYSSWPGLCILMSTWNMK